VLKQIPAIIELEGTPSAAEWLRENRQLVDGELNESGAILLRHFEASTTDHFRRVVELLCGGGIEYKYRSTPRTDLGQGLYTATEYPAGLWIPFHNENAFQREWPLLLMFFCVQSASDGAGQTPLADTVKVTSNIDLKIRQRFMKRDVMYVRNYRENIDLPWQTVFQTESKKVVETFCRERQIDYEWSKEGNLRTRQVCQSFAKHPNTGELIWFNQAHLFHPSALDIATRELMAELFREEDFPRNAMYGDGTPLEESVLQDIRSAYEEEAIQFKWKNGDILILDNMRVSHARTPYRGQRRILTAMGRAFKPEYHQPRID
jgi:alpha-ketoglutarate-dependent taurine dioxygenase